MRVSSSAALKRDRTMRITVLSLQPKRLPTATLLLPARYCSTIWAFCGSVNLPVGLPPVALMDLGSVSAAAVVVRAGCLWLCTLRVSSSAALKRDRTMRITVLSLQPKRLPTATLLLPARYCSTIWAFWRSVNRLAGMADGRQRLSIEQEV
ncbi:MAG: hypothetical protein F4Y52_06070 [Synechococcus sp. SB0664_bin_36]|nr:hypothetical protein [Synechococcus sp. SB0664_bin_36]